jgi:multiple sugar transport system substrate-binding protein
VRDASGRITTEGFGIAPGGQDHHLIREVLFRQWGASPYSLDSRRVTHATPPGRRGAEVVHGRDHAPQGEVTDFFPGANGYRNAFMARRAASRPTSPRTGCTG